ncbi:hypothetical protein DXG03_003589 [Asterophora parasitica]|uniref:DM2 domain-containing protein n=1 Tax=Asterophora parasitica TaxID=117018 RepID=A0A9P7K9D6_9AGAR|nr:hypothetical protein DXG03_003589 [Asterophora parasitica]
MAFDFNTLEAPIYEILAAPGIDLTTISAKSVRRQLQRDDPSLTPEFLRENKKAIDLVIARVFESVNEDQGGDGSNNVNDDTEVPESRKRKESSYEGEEGSEEEGKKKAAPPSKKPKLSKNELSDAELARQLSDELNGRSRRTTSTKSRGNANGAAKKGARVKSAAMVDSDVSGDEGGARKMTKPKKKAPVEGGGTAKGGFAKEYFLSEPLAALLKVSKLSRPQVVKQLWVYIKDHELQNPENKKEIVADGAFRAVFGVDKIDMFKMNKVLGQ